jgi:hypothetical protein
MAAFGALAGVVGAVGSAIGTILSAALLGVAEAFGGQSGSLTNTALIGHAVAQASESASLTAAPPGQLYFPAVPVLVIGNVFAGNGIANVFRTLAGNSALAVCTFFDPASQDEIDPDTVTATLIDPNNQQTALLVERQRLGQYAAVPAFTIVGEYALTFEGTVGTSVMSVQGFAEAIAPYVSSAPVQDPWYFVTALVTPFQMVKAVAKRYGVDLRVGPVWMITWPTPLDGDRFTIADWYNLSSMGSAGPGSPGGPITLASAGPSATPTGVLIEDPSSPGTFAQQVYIADPNGFAGEFVFSQVKNAWKIAT